MIDHRNFNEAQKRSENSDDLVVDDIEEMDIVWRDDSSEYSEYIKSLSNVEDGMNELNLNNEDRQTVFLTETTSDQPRLVNDLKKAWDDDANEEDCVDIDRTNNGSSLENSPRASHNLSSEKSPSLPRKPRPPAGVRVFQEKDPVSGITVSMYDRSPAARDYATSGNSPAHRKSRRASHPAVLSTRFEEGSYLSDGELSQDEGTYQMTQSPVANRSVGLSRVALMRLSRQKRGDSRGVSPSSRGVDPRPRTRSHSPFSYKREMNQEPGDET